MKNKKIFITGGAGFIASHICERLIEQNKIVIFDNNTRNAIKWTKIKNHPNLTHIKGDVLDSASLKKTMKGSNIVIHCAAIAGIYSVSQNPSLTLKVNFIGTYNTLEAALKNKIERFVDFSTSEVYGPYVYRGKENDLTTQGPLGETRWTYAVGKLAAEHLTHSYYKEYGLPIVTIRPFNIYGPRQVGEGAIRGMIINALKNESITLYNHGTQVRAWCYVEDFVKGILAVLTAKKAVGHVFNLGNPQGATTNIKLAKTIRDLAGATSRIIFKKHPGPEVEIRVPSIDLAEEILNFNPKISLETGIVKTIGWYRNHIIK